LAKQIIDKTKIDAKRRRKKLLDPARRAIAQAKTGGPDRLARETMLECLSGQFVAIETRVLQDVANVRPARRNVLPLGFIMYPLRGPKGEELTDVAISELGLNQNDIEASTYFKALDKACSGMNLKLRLDQRYLSDQPQLTRSLFVVVDGWS
jgi:hypothetical protein